MLSNWPFFLNRLVLSRLVRTKIALSQCFVASRFITIVSCTKTQQRCVFESICLAKCKPWPWRILDDRDKVHRIDLKDRKKLSRKTEFLTRRSLSGMPSNNDGLIHFSLTTRQLTSCGKNAPSASQQCDPSWPLHPRREAVFAGATIRVSPTKAVNMRVRRAR